MTITIRPGGHIEWSREAAVWFDGEAYSAFQRHSYIARVKLNTGEEVVVVLPSGAAASHPDAWASKALEAAREAAEQGSNVAVAR